ncbi:hypothetical protein CKO42_02840 [Lamprobacter modestohalophilus]|uniref:HPr-rel-A system PqqD family peptide chaperone n=1 Tax=Lamprobacter modestohalophilus TaxID=1064514 RepID=A0A9X0W5K7_9GAMM|nr:hypothetical protein [Lamprobacter modestohalophilus]
MWHTCTSNRSVCAWQDEQIVFFPRSGETHYLNHCASSILERLDLEHMSTESLHRSLKDSRSQAPSLDEVRSILNRFNEHGLVEDI